MTDAPAEPDPLPALREELTLHAGPAALDGSPTWSLQDPVRNQFFMIDWPTFEVLARWHLGRADALLDAVNAETALELTPDDIEGVRRFLADNQLIQLHSAAGTAELLKREKALHSGVWTWLLHHYLFFRLPLVRPDRWLEAHLPLVRPFYTKTFLHLTLAVLLVGLVQVFRQWEHFTATLVDTLSWQGAAGYAVALAVVKVLHELGHGFTAKRLGCRVPTMGVAFLVMFPMAYTEINEVWKLTQRRDRLAVGAAGILTELAIAAWATLAWALLPDGGLRSIVFLLATTTWVSTLIINASPFMRFDGYFLLSDAIGMPNLHSRAFALARWDLRERLFRFGEAVPEHFSPSRQRALILFAWAVWIYRLIIFLGIAAMVYQYFFKALGIFLFAVEIGWFIVLPIWHEIAAWRQRWPLLKDRSHSRRSLTWVLLLLLGFLPLNFQVVGQGMLRPLRHFTIHAPGAAQVAALPVGSGTVLADGAPLLVLALADAQMRSLQAAAKLERARWQVQVAGFDEALRNRQTVLQEELAAAEAESLAMQREEQRYSPVAPYAGVLVDLPPDLRVGDWVGRNERLGTLIDPSGWRVEMYLDEAEVGRVSPGDRAHFFPETPGQPRLTLHVSGIDRDATRRLAEPMLALGHGGELMVRERGGQLVPERAIYRLTLIAPANERPPMLQALRGKVVIYGRPKSLLGDFMRSTLTLLVRESGW